MSSSFPHTNALIHSGSPYLLQHAHNPVNWFPWGEEALEKARLENKPLLISIGYSACHWCHVMERESFEDEETAALMNEYFICIKVDREEHPDIDQLYMTAVQLMNNRGGWPLNCFALPDGRPVYGGTYFPRQNWQHVLRQIHKLYTENYEEVLKYASTLSGGIRQTALLQLSARPQPLTREDVHQCVHHWMELVDTKEGGPNRAPKFPLPNNYRFLLRYGQLSNNEDILQHVHLTLKKVAYGGIYDQVGGGFARYSTDVWWKVPHFEKMLYDNAQLLSLYAEAAQQSGEELYKEVCFQTIEFVARELAAPEGYFYSALDADSEGVEGKFYTWTEEELHELLTEEEFRVASAYFNLNEKGYWEEQEEYILLRREEDPAVAQQLGISTDRLREIILSIRTHLLRQREQRVHPGLDDKLLSSWNGMMIRGLADCYRTFGNEDHRLMAEKAAEFLLEHLLDKNGNLWHTWKNGKASIPAYLEDYCFLVDAFIALYRATFEEKWLFRAGKLCETVLEDFSTENETFFYFTSIRQKEWVTRQLEISDNVIPASNSVMALNLYYLGIWLTRPAWMQRAVDMLGRVRSELIGYGPGYSNWAMLALHETFPFNELAVTGAGAREAVRELRRQYRPNLLEAVSESASALPFLEGRTGPALRYFVCRGTYCEAPVFSVEDVLHLLKDQV